MPRRRISLRPLLLTGLAILIITEIVVLTPSRLEENHNPIKAIDPQNLIQDNKPSLVPGIPRNRIPEYSVEKFRYVGVQNSEKQWQIEADVAFMYNPEKLVHSRTVKVWIFDPDGQTTIITGEEAKYFLNKKDLEIFGNVITTFPDGFQLRSDYLRYKPNERFVEIPSRYFVQGIGDESQGQKLQFTSQGLTFDMNQSIVILPQAAKVTLLRSQSRQTEEESRDNTTIESDHCFINRKTHLAKFTMNPNRPLKNRFVYITQPTLFTKARRADLNYGSFNQVLDYLTAFEDVFIKERGEGASLRYATGGRADFDTHQNIIVLTKFPQVYQDTDTIVGDKIILHRDTDIVEVEHSNAFSQGN